MWFSHQVQGYTAPGEWGQLGGGIYQWTQFNLQLLARSAHSANWWPPSSQHLWYHHSLPPLLKSTIPSEKREVRGQLCLFTPTPSPVQSLEKGEPWLQSLAPNSEGNRTWLLHNPRDAPTAQSWTDRQTGARPRRHIPSLLHTQGLEQLLDQSHRQCRWGMVPIPLGKAEEASFEIPGVPKSWACTRNSWRPRLRLGPQPHKTWHEYNVLRNSACDWFRYRGLNFLVKSHWVHLQYVSITSRFVWFIYCFFKKKQTKNT